MRRTRRGQGLTEYIITVALVAIAAIGVITLFGDNVRRLVGMSADSLAGETSVKNTTQKATTALTQKRLSNFAENNAPGAGGLGGGGSSPNAGGSQ